MKELIKKWLGINRLFELQANLRTSFEKEIQEKIDYLRRIDKETYVSCYKCGVVLKRLKATPKAILDSERENNEGTLNQYNMEYAFFASRGDSNVRVDTTSTIYFCSNCNNKK